LELVYNFWLLFISLKRCGTWSEDLDERKGEVLVRIWKEKEKAKRAKEERNMEESKIRERNKDG